MATINIEISGNPIDVSVKQNALISLSKLDTDTLKKLHQVANSEKAIKKFNSSWTTIKLMFGV